MTWPHKGLTVIETGTGKTVRKTKTNAQGGFSFRGLKPGPYFLILSVDGKEAWGHFQIQDEHLSDSCVEQFRIEFSGEDLVIKHDAYTD